MRFAKYGLRELMIYGGASGALTVLAFALSFHYLRFQRALLITFPFAVICALILWFFRDPKRIIPRGEGRILAPADGIVYDIGEVDEPEFLGERALRIGIFLSVFDCHVNRAPCSGTVEKIIYRRGRFLSALNANECSRLNESNFIGIADAAGKGLRIGVKQIAGRIARRIVCELKEGDRLRRGQPFGMIKFGSRTELFIPKSANFQLRVKVGAGVDAGSTVVAVLGVQDDEAVLEEAHEQAAPPAEPVDSPRPEPVEPDETQELEELHEEHEPPAPHAAADQPQPAESTPEAAADRPPDAPPGETINANPDGPSGPPAPAPDRTPDRTE